MIGYEGLVWIVLAVLLAARARAHLPFTVALTAACVWSADLIALPIKIATDRPRPFVTIPQADPLLGGTVTQSMPSAHAATSFAGAVLLAYLFRSFAPFAFLLAVAVAFSRVYVGVHYPSDVLAGAALGTAVGLVFVAVVRARRPIAAGLPRSGGAPPAG